MEQEPTESAAGNGGVGNHSGSSWPTHAREAGPTDRPTRPGSDPLERGDPGAPDTVEAVRVPAGEADTVVEVGDGVAAKERTAAGGQARIGRFEIREMLGRGGMGVVYRAHDPGLRRDVALKLLGAADRADHERIERFFREARTAGCLQHPGIVSVHEMGTVDGTPFAVMELVEGETLEAAMGRGGLDSLEERIRILREIARAVEHAHRHGVVHRDLKPANVMLDPSGRPRVLDFGLARRLDGGTRMTASGQLMGTPGFMPPEQIEGAWEQIGPPCDVFALGAILYELLTSVPPFLGSSPMETLGITLRGDPVPPRKIAPDVPAALEAVCLRSLEPDPGRRYADAGALADDLDRWRAGEPVVARPAPWTARVSRAWARRRAVWLPVGITLLFVAAAGVGYAWRTRAERRVRAAEAVEAGRALRQRGDVEAAREQFRRALELDPDHAAAREGVAWADAERARLAAEVARARGLQALAEAERALMAAQARIKTGKPARAEYEKAVDLLEKAIRAAPDDPRGPYLLGCARVDMADIAEREKGDPRPLLAAAVQAHTRALDLAPEASQVRLMRAFAGSLLASARRSAGEDPRDTFQAAIADFDLVLAADPESHAGYGMRGNAHYNLGDAEKALGGDPVPAWEAGIRDFRALLERNAGMWTASLSLCDLLDRLGRPEEAMAVLRQAEAVAPSEPKVRARREKLERDAARRSEGS